MKKFLVISLLVSACSFYAQAQYRDVKLPDKPEMTKYEDLYKKSTGFWCSLELEGGSSIMVHKPNLQYTSLTFIGGYRFSEFLRIGLGFGSRLYLHNANLRLSDNVFGLPIFAHVRGNFISAYDRDGVPMWSLSIGGITNDGFFISPTFGYSFGGLRNNIFIGINYSLGTFTNYRRNDVVYSYLGLKVGYEF
ncbi:MAG: hypothetical protein IJF06_02090 [Bacteroidaceae bacterium]|nr:hypothetical protein [Bacteroidaceae bacterium]MBR4066631.1 hypothetical protein [Bacteroidaceae bacterium]